MGPHPNRFRRAPRRRAPAGFSLPELMIALVILGLGLLIIAAALPVGLTYTRQSSDLALGDAAVDYGMQQVQMLVRPARTLEHDGLTRPRELDVGLGQFVVNHGYEPLVKVRPLMLENINATPGLAPSLRAKSEPGEGEAAIEKWFGAANSAETEQRHSEDYQPVTSFPAYRVASALTRVYPPITPRSSFAVNSFFSGLSNGVPTREISDPTIERAKALDSRVSWTAFYRRVSYKWDVGTDLIPGTADDKPLSDPLLYEVIVVAARRPTVQHVFPTQDLSSSALDLPDYLPFTAAEGEEGAAGNAATGSATVAQAQSSQATRGQADRLAPEPWLVTFKYIDSSHPGLPIPRQIPVGDVSSVGYWGPSADRPLGPKLQANPPATLTFNCSDKVGRLLPVGSIFIPACNDERPTFLNPPGGLQSIPPNRHAGFVPHAPESLPIYKVVERPDANTVVVENPGFYPWVDPNISANDAPNYWPVWVIPPAVRNEGGVKLFESQSPVVAVSRQMIRFSEAP